MNKQRGFTLVEIAIVLVIIGLLLGGILKGQELINSARVRNLADTTTGVQAAYYGFIDRFRRVPGDWRASSATLAIGVPVGAGGNDNGRLDDGATIWEEPNALWVQLAAAGFIQGSYNGGTIAPITDNGVSPLNAFNNVMIMVRSPDYLAPAAIAVADIASRLHLVIGAGIPVDVMRELDQKVDDANPRTGDLRGTVDGGAAFGTVAEQEAACVDAANSIWNVTGDAQNCNAVYLF